MNMDKLWIAAVVLMAAGLLWGNFFQRGSR